MNKYIIAVASVSFFALSPSLVAAKTVKCVKTDQEKIERLFDKWNSALSTGDALKVNALYESDATLLPTLSNEIRHSQAERVDYFEHFLKGAPVGKIDSRTIRIGCNEATDSGAYTFTFKDKSSVKARYTFNYGWDGKEWKITTHHSSAMPES